MLTWRVRTAWDRDEAWFKFVDPTERCLVARLFEDIKAGKKKKADIRTHE